MNIPKFSVRHSIMANLLTIVVLTAGLWKTAYLQRETFPTVDLDIVVVSTRYPNASPEEVEDLITAQIEEEIREVDGIDEYTSRSTEGLSVIVIQVDPDARYVQRVITDIQRSVDQVDDLPDEAEEPIVEVILLEHPVIKVCVGGRLSESDTRTYAEYLEDRLEGIPGVSKVDKEGWRKEEFWVEVDPAALRENEVSLVEVIDSLARRNINRPGGKIARGDQEIVLRTIGQFHTAEEIEQVVVRSNSDGNHLRVSDLGSVRRVFEEDSIFSRVNGSRSVVLVVEQKQSGDTINIADAVKALVAEEQFTMPEGIEISLIDDVSYYVKRRLKVLSSNGLIGLLLVVGTLFIFLNMRTALVTAVGIPFSFLGTFLVMSFFGVTINLMTMFGLIIVIGMVVDDAIIVGENVHRHIESGQEPRLAAIEGASEVMKPVVATVLTTIAAFFPLMFLPGVMGKFLRWVPIVVMIALIASLIECIFILPSHAADFLRPVRKKKDAARHDIKEAHWMGRGQQSFGYLLKTVLKGRYVFVALSIFIFLASVGFAVKKQEVNIFPADLIDVFEVKVTAPEGAPLSLTEQLVAEVEGRVEQLPEDELQDYISYVGQQLDQHGRGARGTRYGQLIVYLSPQHERARKTQQIVNDLRELCADIDGIERLDISMMKPGPPVGQDVEVKVRGDSYDVLVGVAERIKSFLSDKHGVNDIQDDFDEGKQERHVLVDEEEAARLGISVADVAQTVYTAFEGAESTVVREGTDELKVRVRLKEPERSEFSQLGSVQVRNNTGRLIDLHRVATFEDQQGLPPIMHHDGSRVITVSATVDKEVASSARVSVELEKKFASISQEFPGYQLLRGGEWKESRKLLVNMSIAFLVALLLIYTILATQFDSFLQPFVVMAAIPFGLIGVIMALYVHGKPISMMALLGMAGLTGVVVNDAIVLVSFIYDLRKSGINAFDSVVTAAQKRVRPIVLTSITTVAGLMPVIYGWGGYEPFIAPAAITLAYGLVFATILTLLLVPCLYLIGHDLKVRAAACAQWIRGSSVHGH